MNQVQPPGRLHTQIQARGGFLASRHRASSWDNNAAVIELDGLYKDFKKIADRDAAQDMVREVVLDTAQHIKAMAQQYAPKKTGALANSITFKLMDMGMAAEIYPQVDYASYQEYGTGIRGEFRRGAYEIKPKNGKYLKFVVNGRVIHAKRVVHPGIRPHPYMRPAALDAAERFVAQIADGTVDLLVNTPDARKAGRL